MTDIAESLLPVLESEGQVSSLSYGDSCPLCETEQHGHWEKSDTVDVPRQVPLVSRRVPSAVTVTCWRLLMQVPGIGAEGFS